MLPFQVKEKGMIKMKKKLFVLGIVLLAFCFMGCEKQEKEEEEEPIEAIEVHPTKENCEEKKFEYPYSYIYPTYSECINEGNWAFFEISETKDYEVFAYGCEEIVDECGNTYYGVYYNVYQDGKILKRHY